MEEPFVSDFIGDTAYVGGRNENATDLALAGRPAGQGKGGYMIGDTFVAMPDFMYQGNFILSLKVALLTIGKMFAFSQRGLEAVQYNIHALEQAIQINDAKAEAAKMATFMQGLLNSANSFPRIPSPQRTDPFPDLAFRSQ